MIYDLYDQATRLIWTLCENGRLKDENGGLISDKNDILKRIHDFYQDLLTEEVKETLPGSPTISFN